MTCICTYDSTSVSAVYCNINAMDIANLGVRRYRPSAPPRCVPAIGAMRLVGLWPCE